MKITDLVKNREKIRKYDELMAWKNYFGSDKARFANAIYHVETAMISCGTNTFEIPEHIRTIILAALDAEIAKLDED